MSGRIGYCSATETPRPVFYAIDSLLLCVGCRHFSKEYPKKKEERR